MNQRVTRGTALLKWLRYGVWAITVSIGREIFNELKVLNRGGKYSTNRAARSRGQRAREFKANLAKQYDHHTLCC